MKLSLILQILLQANFIYTYIYVTIFNYIYTILSQYTFYIIAVLRVTTRNIV